MSYNDNELGLVVLSGGCLVLTIFATLISCYSIALQNRNVSYESAQQKIIFLYTTPIVIAWLNWIQLRFGGLLFILDYVCNAYRAISLLIFMGYLFRLLGWEKINQEFHYSKGRLQSNLIRLGEVQHTFSCLGKFTFENADKAKQFKQKIKWMTVQYSLTLILLSIISVIVRFADSEFLLYGEANIESLYIWVNIVLTISCFIALYYLILLFKVFQRLEDYTHFKFHLKISSAIAGLLLPQIQQLVILIFIETNLISEDEDPMDQMMTTNSALYCIEMGALALVFSLIFPSSEYFKWPGSIDISYTADNSEASQLPRV